MTESEVRREMVQMAKIFASGGLTLGSWGNFSCRFQDTFVITPSGLPYEQLQEEDVVIMGRPSRNEPSSEVLLHKAIYSARPDLQAIVHTHSTFATVLAVQHRSLPVLTEDGVQLAAEDIIPCAKYVQSGTEELAAEAVGALGKGFAVLLANHGAVACGYNLRQALLFSQLLEKMAQVYCVSTAMGGVVYPLPVEAAADLRSFYFNYYAKRQEGRKNDV